MSEGEPNGSVAFDMADNDRSGATDQVRHGHQPQREEDPPRRHRRRKTKKTFLKLKPTSLFLDYIAEIDIEEMFTQEHAAAFPGILYENYDFELEKRILSLAIQKC